MRMKKYIPLFIAAAVFVLALFLLQPEGRVNVVVVMADLPAGHTIEEADVSVREIPQSFAPGDALSTTTQSVGKTIKTDRSRGDILRQRHLGEPFTLGPDERAVAIPVDDASGMGGMIAPGDLVGLTAVIYGNNLVFSKVTAEGFRVLYVSPEFRAGFSESSSSGGTGGSVSVARERSSKGTVILAVPIALMDVKYDFTYLGGSVEIRKVNVVELISALTASGNARIVLYKVPQNAATMESPGLYLPDLVLIPTPTTEPTPTAEP
jgi:Flp pilus assembly protein CpaB